MNELNSTQQLLINNWQRKYYQLSDVLITSLVFNNYRYIKCLSASKKGKVMAKKLYKVTHVMADGTELDDITGYVIPAGHQVYNILKSINEKQAEVQTA